MLYDHLREISENLFRCSENEVKISRGALKTKKSRLRRAQEQKRSNNYSFYQMFGCWSFLFGFFLGKIRPRSGRELFVGLFFGKIGILYDRLRDISENLSKCSENEVKIGRGVLKTKKIAPAARTRAKKIK